MKKFLTIIGIIFIFFFFYFLQANFFTWFNIGGVMPNIFVILVLFIGLFIGKKVGLILGFIFGIYIDVLIGKAVGISAIMLGIIGIFAEYIDKNFSKDSRITIMLMVAISTMIYEIGMYAFQVLKWGATLEIVSFFRILGIEVFFNVILVIIFYPCIQKVGYIVENIFKNKTILTRYF